MCCQEYCIPYLNKYTTNCTVKSDPIQYHEVYYNKFLFIFILSYLYIVNNKEFHLLDKPHHGLGPRKQFDMDFILVSSVGLE